MHLSNIYYARTGCVVFRISNKNKQYGGFVIGLGSLSTVLIAKNRGHRTVTRFVQKHTSFDSQNPELGSTKCAKTGRLLAIKESKVDPVKTLVLIVVALPLAKYLKFSKHRVVKLWTFEILLY